ncbi:MAG: hypothetical protein MR842_11135 [Clostridiales bacterium]|nr:hypothetical protein [Clostridiales bacterium]MDO4350552.1 hypothetical protein [Eubacteriales bacterium]
MNRPLALLMTAALLLAAACGLAETGGCTFPDLSVLLGTPCETLQKNYAFAEDFVCDAYVWAYPQGWTAQDDLLLATLAQLHGGWSWERGEVEGHDAFLLSGSGGEQAMIVSEFDGRVLALVPAGCDVITVGERIQETPAPEEPAPTAASHGHWEWQTTEVDCPSCVNGWCSVCNGTGIYRLYGQTVACRIYCSSCDGRGTITQRTYVFVPDR